MTWSELVNAALIGAGRAPLREPGPILAGLDPAGASADSRARLLDQAAAMSRARRAGFRPPDISGQTAPDPAEPDERLQVSLAAEVRLEQLLAAAEAGLVAEWLRLLAGTRLRPPDALVPALLGAATARRELRRPVQVALGPLAGWLARFNQEWDWIRTDHDAQPEQWATADIATRRLILARQRGSDPAAGRELVQSTWATDSSAERAAFVAALRDGLSLADEPFLEIAATDRRAEVRRAAAELLARLPGSAAARRAAAAATAAVGVRYDGARPALAITLPRPAEPEPAAAGPVADAAADQRVLLRQVIAAAPAEVWTERTGLEPAELLTLAENARHSRALRSGWTTAAIRDTHLPWLRALLDRADAPAVNLLLPALPGNVRDDWLAAHPGYLLSDGIAEQVPAPWSVRLSDQVRGMLARGSGSDPHGAELRALIRLAAGRLEPPEPPGTDPQNVHDRLRAPWNAMLNTLSIRAAMRRELTEEPRP